MKRGLIIRHVPHEGVAGFRAPIEAAGYVLDRIDVADSAFASLDLTQPDLLIMMGGPMGVYEQEEHPWIACQLRRLARRLEARRPTLGVCFGAQMIAAALGAPVYKGPRPEVGFGSVEIVATPDPNPLQKLQGVPVLHWHGDTFELPDGAELLAFTDQYRHQAFRVGREILALQFHSEMGEDPRFDAWIEQWPEAAIAAAGSCAALKAQHDSHGPAAVAAGRAMLSEWLPGLEPAREGGAPADAGVIAA